MKNLTIAILLLATALFGGLYFYQSHKATVAQASAAGLEQKATELQSSLENQDNRAKRLRDQLEATRADAAALSQEAAQLRANLKTNSSSQAPRETASTPAPTNAKPANPLSELFKNPEMREMIKNQQKTVLGGMIDKNYKQLFANLHLSPEQSTALKDLILNKQLTAAEMGLSMFSGDQDAAKRTEMVQQIKTASDAADAQIKELLGDDNFAQFQAYEKTMGERTVVSGFKDQLGSGSAALNDSQEQQLIQAMTQERQSFKFTTDFSDKSKLNGDFASMLSEDKMNVFFQELGQLNQRYLTHAQAILSPDQYTSFEKYLNNQQAMQKAGFQMAAKMFAPAKAGGN